MKTTVSKILVVFPVSERGGAENVFMAIARYLDRSRFEPLAWFLRPGPLVSEIESWGVKTLLHPITRVRDFPNYRQAVAAGHRFIMAEGVSLVLSSLGYGHLYGGVAAFQSGVRAAWWQHGIASPMNWIDRLATWIPSSLIITSSQVAARAHQDAFGIDRPRMVVIHPGVDCARHWVDRVAMRRSVEEEFGLSPGTLVISTIGRLQPGKGQKTLIRAASAVKDRHSRVTILVVGSEMFGMNSGYSNELMNLAADVGLGDTVVFTGFRSDIPRILAATDIFVHSAQAPESFGLAVVEAMAAGAAVIVTDVGGPAEIITDGETGLIVPPGNDRLLTDAIDRLAVNPSWRTSLGAKAREYAVAHFTQQQMIEKVGEALTGVMEKAQ